MIYSKTTGRAYEVRVLSVKYQTIHHEDLKRIVKEEGISLAIPYSAYQGYPFFVQVAELNGVSVQGIGTCPPGCSGGLASTDPAKAAYLDAYDNAISELMQFDWENYTGNDLSANSNSSNPAAATNPVPSTSNSAPIAGTHATAAVNTAGTADSAKVPSAANTSEKETNNGSDNFANEILRFGRCKNRNKTIAEVYAEGGEWTEWFNYICNTEKYAGKYPDMMRKYRASLEG